MADTTTISPEAARLRDEAKRLASRLDLVPNTPLMLIIHAAELLRQCAATIDALAALAAPALAQDPSPDYQRGYDAAIAECARLGWRGPGEQRQADKLDLLTARIATLETAMRIAADEIKDASSFSGWVAIADDLLAAVNGAPAAQGGGNG